MTQIPSTISALTNVAIDRLVELLGVDAVVVSESRGELPVVNVSGRSFFSGIRLLFVSAAMMNNRCCWRGVKVPGESVGSPPQPSAPAPSSRLGDRVVKTRCLESLQTKPFDLEILANENPRVV